MTIVLALISSACGGPPEGSIMPTNSSVATPIASIPGLAAPHLSALAFFDRDHGLLGGNEVQGADSGSNPAKGLLWQTSDGGSTWDPIAFDGLPVIALATAGDQDVWAATGCLDGTCPAAVLASVDAGRTWSTASNMAVGSLTFVDAHHGWAVTQSDPPNGGNLLETNDGGRTWTVLPRPCPIGIGIAASFVTADHGWLGCGLLAGAGQEPKAVLETMNGGRTWAVRSEAGINVSVGTISSSDYVAGLAMRPSGVGLMWMTRGTTVATSNAGRTWRPIPPGEFDVSLPAAGVALDDRTWFLLMWDGNLGRSALEMSRDAGATWIEVGSLPT